MVGRFPFVQVKPGNGLLLVTTVWVVEIFTTDGINLSAKSANELGIL